MHSPIHNPLIDIHVQVKNLGPKDPALSCPKETAQGSRYRAQGKNNKRKLILSLCLARYDAKRRAQSENLGMSKLPLLVRHALCSLRSDLAPRTRFFVLNKVNSPRGRLQVKSEDKCLK
jgi:hypothetical protein